MGLLEGAASRSWCSSTRARLDHRYLNLPGLKILRRFPTRVFSIEFALTKQQRDSSDSEVPQLSHRNDTRVVKQGGAVMRVNWANSNGSGSAAAELGGVQGREGVGEWQVVCE